MKSRNKGNTVKSRNYWKDSHNQSVGERRIEEYLRKSKIFFISEARLSDCINPKTGQVLIFDFYLPQHRVMIEYNGTQHEEYTPKFHGPKKLQRFEKQQYKDQVKRDYCIDKGLKLIELFWKDWENMENILNKNLKIK